jgi:hypothetical protein
MGALADLLLPAQGKLPGLELKGINKNPIYHYVKMISFFFGNRKGLPGLQAHKNTRRALHVHYFIHQAL